MIRYIPISVHDDGVHCGECQWRITYTCYLFCTRLASDEARLYYQRCADCLAQAKEIPSD